MGKCGSVIHKPLAQQFAPSPNLGSLGRWGLELTITFSFGPSPCSLFCQVRAALLPTISTTNDRSRNSVMWIKSTPKHFLWNIQKMLIKQQTKPNGPVPEHLQQPWEWRATAGQSCAHQGLSVPLVTIYSRYRNIPKHQPPTRSQDFKEYPVPQDFKEDPIPLLSGYNATKGMNMRKQAAFLQKESISVKANQTKLPRTSPLATDTNNDGFCFSKNSNFMKWSLNFPKGQGKGKMRQQRNQVYCYWTAISYFKYCLLTGNWLEPWYKALKWSRGLKTCVVTALGAEARNGIVSAPLQQP